MYIGKVNLITAQYFQVFKVRLCLHWPIVTYLLFHSGVISFLINAIFSSKLFDLQITTTIIRVRISDIVRPVFLLTGVLL